MCTALGFSKDFTAYIRPQQDEVSPLHPVALGENTFHSRGHLPFPIPPDVCVATPTPFARKGFWGVRPLSEKERRMCMDIPEIMLPFELPGFDGFLPIGLFIRAITCLTPPTQDKPPPLQRRDTDSDSDNEDSLPPL